MIIQWIFWLAVGLVVGSILYRLHLVLHGFPALLDSVESTPDDSIEEDFRRRSVASYPQPSDPLDEPGP